MKWLSKIKDLYLANKETPAHFPTYLGYPIYEYVEDIKRLKRDGQYVEALILAEALYGAMMEQAPKYLMDWYADQVAMLYHKLKMYDEEKFFLRNHLSQVSKYTTPRGDYRLKLYKRFNEEPPEGIEPGNQFNAPLTGASTNNYTAPKELVPARFELHKGFDFVAIDFETANKKAQSACSVSLVRSSDNAVFHTFLWSPYQGDDWEFTHLHGIKAVHVSAAPTFQSIYPEIKAFIGELPLVAHNVAFDSKVWKALGGEEHKWWCTLESSRYYIKGLENYKLPTVLAAVKPSQRLIHHNDLSDAKACLSIMKYLQGE